MALSTAGFQPGSAVLCNWFDPNLLLLERASMGGASQVKGLLQGLLDPNDFLESVQKLPYNKKLEVPAFTQSCAEGAIGSWSSPSDSSLLAACSMIALGVIQTRKHSLRVP